MQLAIQATRKYEASYSADTTELGHDERYATFLLTILGIHSDKNYGTSALMIITNVGKLKCEFADNGKIGQRYALQPCKLREAEHVATD